MESPVKVELSSEACTTIIKQLKTLKKNPESAKDCVKDEILSIFHGYNKSEARRSSHTMSSETVFKISKLLSRYKEEPVYLHELLHGSKLHLPSPEVLPRNPELEARIQRLKAEQANREYEKMVENVSGVMSKKTIASAQEEVRSVRSQVAAVINFILAVIGSFAFVYKAVEYSLPSPDIVLQLLASIIVASVVAIAELYFLAQVL